MVSFVMQGLGLLGVVMILFSYWQIQRKAWQSTEPRYFIFNGLGALWVLFSLIDQFNLPAFVIETCWLLISIQGWIQNRSIKP